MVIGLFFGSFNPLHKGHLKLADTFYNQTQMDELWWMVSPQNPHKSPLELAPFEHRLHMLRDAIQTAHYVVSDFEAYLPTPSFTIDTLTALCNQFPVHQWKILMGQDSWNALPTWKSGSDIENQFDIWVYGRPGATEWRSGKYHPLHFEPLPISSTGIRAQIQSKVPLEKMDDILPITQTYIKQHQLYQGV